MGAVSAIWSPLHRALGRYSNTGNAGFPLNAAPSLDFLGLGIQDHRLPYNSRGSSVNQPGIIGWYGHNPTVTANYTPSAVATANIAANQHLTSGTAMTLVSSSGAGITVLSTTAPAFFMPTGLSQSAGVVIDGLPSFHAFGANGNFQTGFYNRATCVGRAISVTAAAGATGGAILLSGLDVYGYPMTQTVTAVAGQTVNSLKTFKCLISAVPQFSDSSHNYSIGTADIYGLGIAPSNRVGVEAKWNNAPLLISATAQEQTVLITAQLADLVNSAQWQLAVPFNFTLVSMGWRTGKPASTSSKLATVTAQVNGTSVGSGGVVALTTANQNLSGTLIAGTAISGGGQVGTAGQTIGFAVSSVTAFAEGDGWAEFTLINNDIINGTYATGAEQTVIVPAQLPDLTGTEQWQVNVPFNFTLKSIGWRTGKPASTASKLATLTAQVNGASVTGGVVSLTTANQNATGTLTAGTAITAGGTGTAGQTVGFVLSSVTAFGEGDGWAELTIVNNDLANGLSATAVEQTVIIPAQLADLTGTEQWEIVVPFNFTVSAMGWRTGKPASTSAKTATLTAQVNGASVLGGAVTITTANQNATGTLTAASAIGANATGAAGSTLGFVLSSVTAFAEGDGWAEFTITNNDLLNGGKYTAPDTTSPATSSTGDVRGTVTTPPSNGGNQLLLQIFPVLGSLVTNPTTGLFGQAQV